MARGVAGEGPSSWVLGALFAGDAVANPVRTSTVVKGLAGIGGVLILSCMVSFKNEEGGR